MGIKMPPKKKKRKARKSRIGRITTSGKGAEVETPAQLNTMNGQRKHMKLTNSKQLNILVKQNKAIL